MAAPAISAGLGPALGGAAVAVMLAHRRGDHPRVGLGGEEAGRQGVGRHAGRAELGGERARQRCQAAFRRDIGRGVGNGEIGHDRGHHDQPAPVAFEHAGHDQLYQGMRRRPGRRRSGGRRPRGSISRNGRRSRSPTLWIRMSMARRAGIAWPPSPRGRPCRRRAASAVLRPALVRRRRASSRVGRPAMQQDPGAGFGQAPAPSPSPGRAPSP